MEISLKPLSSFRGPLLFAQLVSVSSTAADALDVAGGIDVAGGLSVAGGVTFDLWDGMVVPFDGTCPTGWTEYIAGRGRYVVGLPSGGTLEGTSGLALSNLDTRSGHSHGFSGAHR